MIFAEVITNKKRKPFRTRPYLLAISSPGLFTLALEVAPHLQGKIALETRLFYLSSLYEKNFHKQQGKQTNYNSLPSLTGNF